MNPYVPEVVPEPRFKEISCRRIERPTRRTQHGMNNGRRVAHNRIACAEATCLHGSSALGACSAAQTIVSAPDPFHDLPRDPLGLPFVLAARFIDRKFSLERSWARQRIGRDATVRL
jgi:hypothetical protein